MYQITICFVVEGWTYMYNPQDWNSSFSGVVTETKVCASVQHNQRAPLDLFLSLLFDKLPWQNQSIDISSVNNRIQVCMHLSKDYFNTYFVPSGHISVIRVSPGYTWRRNRPKMLFTAVSSPLQIDLMMALTAKPNVQRPCRIGRENLHKTSDCWIMRLPLDRSRTELLNSKQQAIKDFLNIKIPQPQHGLPIY